LGCVEISGREIHEEVGELNGRIRKVIQRIETEGMMDRKRNMGWWERLLGKKEGSQKNAENVEKRKRRISWIIKGKRGNTGKCVREKRGKKTKDGKRRWRK